MGLRKRITGKGFYLSPHLRSQRLGVALLATIIKKAPGQLLKSLLRAVLAAHGPAQHIGIGQIESRKMVPHLNHILLVHHHPVSLPQLLLHHRMQVSKTGGIVEALDVGLHHARFGYAGPNDGTGRHQRQVVAAAQLAQQAAHGGTLNVEAAVGLPAGQQGLDLRVLLKALNGMHINALPLIFQDQPGAVLNVADAALRQHVELFKANVLRHIHIKLCGGQSLRRQVQCRIGRYRQLTHQNTAGVNGPQVGKIFQAYRQLGNFLVQGFIGGTSLHQQLQFVGWETIHLTEFAETGFALEGGHGAQQGHVLLAVTFKQIVLHGIPVAPRIIDVEIGRGSPLGIQKAFEVQVELYGIDIGNAQTVGHHAVGPAAPPHMVKAAREGVAHHVPGNQKIGGKAQLINNAQLLAHPLPRLRMPLTVTLLESVHRQLLQQTGIRGTTARITLFVFNAGKIKVEGAALEQGLAVGQQKGIGRKSSLQTLRRHQPIVLRSQIFCPQMIQQSILIHRPQVPVQVPVAPPPESHRLPQKEARLPGLQGHPQQTVQLTVTHANEFVLGELLRQVPLKGINHPGLSKGRCPLRQRTSAHEVLR